jgi:Tfp pilus assembly protein PilF
MVSRFLGSFAVFAFLLSPLAAQEDSVLYLIGRVVMEDGSSPSPNFRVELVCDSKVVRQSNPNGKGVFSFDLGSVRQTQGVGDASASPTTGGLKETFAQSAWNPPGFKVLLGRLYLDDCLIRLSQNPAYSATDIKLGIRGLLDDPDVGEILVSRRSVVGGTVDASIPPEAREHFTRALAFLSQEKPDRKRGRTALEEAVKVSPEYADAWEVLGGLNLEEQRIGEARKAYEKVVELDADRLGPCLGLAKIAIEEQDWETARVRSQQALEIQPESTLGLLYLGLALYYEGDFARSHAALGRLEALGKVEEYPIALLHLGMLLAKMGDVPAASVRLEQYLKLEPSAQRRASVERQLDAWRRSGALEATGP